MADVPPGGTPCDPRRRRRNWPNRVAWMHNLGPHPLLPILLCRLSRSRADPLGCDSVFPRALGRQTLGRLFQCQEQRAPRSP